MKKIFKSVIKFLNYFGFNVLVLFSLKHFVKFQKNKKEWIDQGGKITTNYMILSDYDAQSGDIKSHYFHQDLLVASFINKHQPKRHLDVGSRIDGFVAHVASFREIEVLDIRPLDKLIHENIKFIQADLMEIQNLEKVDSLSCLHAIEHFGLGRYGDKIDINGHSKGITNLVKLIIKNGILYISFPIGQKEEVHFNAHRVFKVDTILNHPIIKNTMRLLRFDYVDDKGELYLDKEVDAFPKNINYGCGIYTFKKISNDNKNY